MTVKIDVEMRVFDGVIRSPNGPVGTRVAKAGDLTVRRAKENVNRYGRVDTGRMRDRIFAEPVTSTSRGLSVIVVSPQPYSRFQHFGTRYITPAPFLTDALESLRPIDFER